MIQNTEVRKNNMGGFRLSERRNLINVLFCLFAIFQSGLRDINSLPDGNDTPNYLSRFNELLKTPWSAIFKYFSVYNADYDERDQGYFIFTKLYQVFSDNFTGFMFVTAIVFIVPLGVMINKYVKSSIGTILSFIIYFALFSNIVDCLMRQAISLAVILIAIKYILSRNWLKYFGLVFIAFTIHSSAAIAVPFYFLPKFCLSRKWLLLSIIASPFLILSSKFFLSHFVGSVYEKYINDEGFGVITLFLLLLMVSIASYLYFNKIKLVKDYELLISGAIGSMLMSPFIYMGGTLARISYYYILIIVPLIPVIFDNAINNKSRRAILYICSIGFFLFFICR